MVELDSLNGTTLGERYQILLSIGRGGMGAVYEALDLRLERIVAVKVIGLRDGGPALASLRERFHREARAAARLHHINVVTVHDFGTDPALDLDYLVMERLHGSDLAALVTQRPSGLSVPEVVLVLKGALRGVAAGHRLRLIHRDIKPANLFLTDSPDSVDQRVRVLDFGIAQLIPNESTLTQLTVEGQLALSPAYASPEQLRGETELAPTSDVFSLAATAYSLLTGRKPFSPPEQGALAQGYAVTIPPPSALNPSVPEYLDALLGRAMAVRTETRHSDAGEMLLELEAGEFAAQRASHPRDVGERSVLGGRGSRHDDATVPDPPDGRGDRDRGQRRGRGMRAAVAGAFTGLARAVDSTTVGRLLLFGIAVGATGVLGWGGSRLLHAQGWAIRQTPAAAESHCDALFSAVESSNAPNWRPAARACSRAYRLRAADGESNRDLLERSLTARRGAGHLERAERLARELVSLSPGQASSYLVLGEVLHQQRKFEEALWAYMKATELDRSDAMARFRRGQAQFGLGRYSLALEDFRTALRLDPGLSSWAAYHQELATVLFALDRTEEALAAYRQVTILLPEWADGWGNLGMYYHVMKRHGEAVAAYERALQHDPGFFETRPDQRARWQESLRAAL